MAAKIIHRFDREHKRAAVRDTVTTVQLDPIRNRFGLYEIDAGNDKI